MKAKGQRKKSIIVLLAILLCSLGIGYALLQTNLTINGTSKIKGNTWDIHFANLNVTEGSVSIGTGDVAATIQSTNTDIIYTVTLNKPGDFYEFTVDAVNAGTIDGMVESVTSKLNNQPITTLPSYLNYSVTYATDDEIETNHLLKANSSETYKVRIEFKKDITENDLPTTLQTLTLDFGVNYIQANSNGVDVDHPKIIYTANDYDSSINSPRGNAVFLNEAYPETIPYFETSTEALSEIERISGQNLPFYLKHKIEHGIVTESYVEFVITEAMAEANPGVVPGTYALRGEKTREGATWLVDENYVSPYYESNKETMMRAVRYATETTHCSEIGTGRNYDFLCSIANINVGVKGDGTAVVNNAHNNTYPIKACSVSPTGNSACILH